MKGGVATPKPPPGSASEVFVLRNPSRDVQSTVISTRDRPGGKPFDLADAGSS